MNLIHNMFIYKYMNYTNYFYLSLREKLKRSKYRKLIKIQLDQEILSSSRKSFDDKKNIPVLRIYHR